MQFTPTMAPVPAVPPLPPWLSAAETPEEAFSAIAPPPLPPPPPTDWASKPAELVSTVAIEPVLVASTSPPDPPDPPDPPRDIDAPTMGVTDPDRPKPPWPPPPPTDCARMPKAPPAEEQLPLAKQFAAAVGWA